MKNANVIMVKKKKARSIKECSRCGRKLNTERFVFSDYRYCLAKNSVGKYNWGYFCLKCEPYPVFNEEKT